MFRKAPILEDGPHEQRVKQPLSRLPIRLLTRLAYWYLSGWIADIFVQTHPEIGHHSVGLVGSVYSGCDRVRHRRGERINLRRAYKHILECPTCKDRFYTLKRGYDLYETGVLKIVHPKAKAEAMDEQIYVTGVTLRTSIWVKAASHAILVFQDELFGQKHPDLAPYEHYIRGVYTGCEAANVRPGKITRLNKAWKHITKCANCKDHFDYLIQTEKKFAESPMRAAE